MKKLISSLLLLFLLFACAPAHASGPVFASGFTSNGPTVLNQGTNQRGNIYVQAITDPAAPTVTVNTTGSTTHTYYLVGHDGAAACGSGNEGHSGTSTGTTVTNSSNPANNAITIPGGPTAYASYDVLVDATNTSIATCVAQGSVVTDTGVTPSAYTNLGASNEGQINGATFVNPTFNNPTMTGTGTYSTLNGTTINNTGGVNSATFNKSTGSNSTTGLLNGNSNSILVASRNHANTQDIPVAKTDALDDVIFGDPTFALYLFLQDPLAMPEATPPAGVAQKEIVWADSASHQLRVNNNNTGGAYIASSLTPPGNNVIPKVSGSYAQLVGSDLSDDGTAIYPTVPFSMVENAGISGTPGSDNCWADSTHHSVVCSMNNGTASELAKVSGAITNNDCVKWSNAAGVITLVDQGSTCAGAGTVTQMWQSIGVTVAGNHTSYAGPGSGVNLLVSSEINAEAVIPSSSGTVTLGKLYCQWQNSINNLTITVDKATTLGGANTATTLTCNTTGGAATSCSDVAHTPTVAGNTVLDIKIANTNAGATGVISCGFQMTGF